MIRNYWKNYVITCYKFIKGYFPKLDQLLIKLAWPAINPHTHSLKTSSPGRVAFRAGRDLRNHLFKTLYSWGSRTAKRL